MAFRFLCATVSLFLSVACATAATVAIETKGETHRLLVDGKPFFVKGAGGDQSRSLLKECGANAFRTWGADTLESELAEAEKHGLKVAAGIWLGHARHGFKYNDPEQVAAQYKRAIEVIDRYKNHPALLVWSIGNEADGYDADGGDPKVWAAIEQIAAYAKRVDPNHPTMTVVAEVLPKRIESINRLCPSIDIVGINTYAGCKTIGKRYRDAGGIKPYMVTEFGPPGTWEVEKNQWGAVPEPTSTEKARHYKESYEAGILAEKDKLCLGSFAFLWSFKQEATGTWFGMFLPDGSRTGSVDTMRQLWSGTSFPNRVPLIDSIAVDTLEPKPGGELIAKVVAHDPESDSLTAEWLLMEEATFYGVGGDAEPTPIVVKDAVVESNPNSAKVQMPDRPGRYRLFLTLRDGHGGAATANVSLHVPGKVTENRNRLAAPARLPLTIFADHLTTSYAPSGWIGKTDAIEFKPDDSSNPHQGQFAIRCAFNAQDGFGGVVWQSPENDWGDAAGGFDFTGAKRLSFWARGARGGEVVEFKYGLIEAAKPFRDTDHDAMRITLGKEWKQYSFDLTGKDLRRIKTVFAWVCAGAPEGSTFYLDDVVCE